MTNMFRLLGSGLIFLGLTSGTAFAQVIDIETFGSGSYPGPALPAGETTYNYNAPPQPANYPNILTDGDYVLATNTQQGFSSWASIGDHTTGSGYMLLVNADDNQSGEFYRAPVSLTPNESFEFLTYLVTANSQGDYNFCTANEGGLVLPDVTFQIEDGNGGILASQSTGPIPFNATPVWDEYKLNFTTDATTTSVEVVLINNSTGGCGNDLAIDDITFRVAITMEAFDEAITLTDTNTTQNAVLTLGSNDNIDGNVLSGTELYYLATGSSLASGISFNANTGEVAVAAGTPEGTYSFDYQVCETSSQYNCDIATATIIVAFPPLPISTDDDTGSVADSSTGFTPVLNVLDNDTVDSISSPSDFDLSITPGSSLPSALTFNVNTGEVGVLQGAPTGTYTFEYQLCEDGDPTNCETATVTIDVTNPGGGAFCPIGTAPFPGTYHVVSATGGNNTANAVGTPLSEGSTDTGGGTAITYFGAITMDLTGDAGTLAPEGEVIEVVLSSAWGNQARAEILMSADGINYTSLGTTGSGGSVYSAWTSNTLRYDGFTVPAGGARYLQVVQQNGGVRADGVIYGTQCQPSSTPPVITAVDESETVQPSATAQTNVLNVIDNDSFDGITPTVFNLVLNSASSLPPELTFDTATGAVGVVAGAPAGVYTFEYDICEQGTTNCETATVTITVEELPAPSLSMTKVADSTGPHTVGDIITYTYTVLNDGDQMVRDIAINDTHNGSDPAPTPSNEVLLTDSGTVGDSTDAAVDGKWDALAPGDVVTFTGTYTVTAADAANL